MKKERKEGRRKEKERKKKNEPIQVIQNSIGGFFISLEQEEKVTKTKSHKRKYPYDYIKIRYFAWKESIYAESKDMTNCRK